MKLTRNTLVLLSALLTIFECKNRNLDPPFTDRLTLGHSLYNSETECALSRRKSYFFNCHEIVTFYPDGQADILVGGGDVMYRSSYERKHNRITIGEAPGIPKKIIFRVISDSELRRIDDDSEWALM